MGGAFRDELLSSLMKSIIISILRNKRRNISKDKNLNIVNDIVRYIQKNYSKPVSNETIAEIFHFHPVYMNRIFKKQTGISVHAFLVNYRIEMAMNILRTKNVSVSDVAYSVGFSDVVHFIKCFKKHTGKTPLGYRNSND